MFLTFHPCSVIYFFQTIISFQFNDFFYDLSWNQGAQNFEKQLVWKSGTSCFLIMLLFFLHQNF
jgi:hypothetical protein